jgi:hypothetical protein
MMRDIVCIKNVVCDCDIGELSVIVRGVRILLVALLVSVVWMLSVILFVSVVIVGGMICMIEAVIIACNSASCFSVNDIMCSCLQGSHLRCV